MSPERVLKLIAREMVQSGAYKDEGSALKAMAIEQASKKIMQYRRTIRRLQKKYNVRGLEDLTGRIRGCATIQQEEDWLEWKAASELLEGWEQTLRELTHREI